jgi:hypothetical protein
MEAGSAASRLGVERTMKSVLACLVSLAAVLCYVSGAIAEELRPATPVQKSLAPNETHDYTVTAQSSQRLHVTVDQRGIDVVVQLIGPDGRKLVEVDGPTGATGVEDVVVFTREAGEYRVSVVPFEDADSKPGRYEIRLVEPRRATARELATLRSEAEVAGIDKTWEGAVQAGDTAAMAKLMSED